MDINNILQAASQVLNNSGVDILAVLLTGAGVAYSARLINHLFGAKDRKVTQTVAATLAFVAPVLQAFITYFQGHPISNNIIPHFTEILTVATLVYNFILKGGRFDMFLQKIESYQANETVVSDGVSLEPITVTPIAPASSTIDF